MLSKIFVYGSLNTPSNKISKKLVNNSIYLGKGETDGKLYNIGNYPGAVNDYISSNKIQGLIYKIRNLDLINELDKYEEYDLSDPKNSLFIRKAVSVKDEKGNVHRAWIYFYNGSVRNKKQIKKGNYTKYKKNRSKRRNKAA